MPVSGETLRLLMDAGLAGDDLLRVVTSIEADNPVKKRNANAERQARFRAKKKAASVTSNVTNNVTESVTPVAASREPTRVEDNLPPKEISGQEGRKEKNKTRAEDLADFKSELSDLDAERLAAIVKHRLAKKGQLSGLSARLFRKDAASVDMSISEAVDTCISRSWLTVKPEYLAGRHRPNGQAPPLFGDTATDALNRRIARGTYNGHDRESQGNHEVARELPADEGKQRRVAGLISGAVKSFQ